MILRLTNRQLDLLRKEARKVYPVEACALLFGDIGDKEIVVKRVVATPNSLKSTSRFEIDSKAFYDAFIMAGKDGLEFVGFFHSHPAAPVPSNVDSQFMRLWGDAVWLILSSINNDFAAFQMRDNKITALELKLVAKLKE
jgi:proteasome lid subunit RPN8/RPN11